MRECVVHICASRDLHSLRGWPAYLTMTITKPGTNHDSLATIGGGCFWCLDSVFRLVQGVTSVTSGYTGGRSENPNYEQICTGNSGHAEVVQIAFDPSRVSFEQLLKIFWTIHDPTTLNRQGNDSGTQYRSAIFYHSEQQRVIAEKSRIEAQATFSSPIVTDIVALGKFWPAESYHQDYFNKNPGSGYCQYSIPPKVAKLEKKFPEQVARG